MGYTGFLKRITASNAKTAKFSRNYIHLEYTRFIEICGQVKGLRLDDALLQLETNNKRIKTHFKEGTQGCLIQVWRR